MAATPHELPKESAHLLGTRSSQRQWAKTPLEERLAVIKKVRNSIAGSGTELCDLFPPELVRTRADSLTAEIIPLAEACRFLEREAKQLLAPRRLSTKSRPFWLRRVDVEVRREPLGVVLIIGPANYPLFLTGVQALQALVAGNAVILKPGLGGARLANTLRSFAVAAGMPHELFVVLDESISSAKAVIQEGVEKVVLTGSVESGREVYRQAAAMLTPVIMELSGYDPVFVQPGANLDRAAQAIAFGLRLNGGETCIAPRRIYVFEPIAEEFERRLEEGPAHRPIPITRVRNDDEALEKASRYPYALSATIFGEPARAKALARRVQAGVVVVNDIIVPTADPRVPFGGRQLSGFGTTRGAEGLLEFTCLKTVITQNGKRLRHLEPPPPNAEDLFNAYLAASHRTRWSDRLGGWRNLIAVVSRNKRKN